MLTNKFIKFIILLAVKKRGDFFMKKKFLYLIIVIFFMMFLASCNNNSKPDNRATDNELTKKAYEEFLKSFDNLTYDDFLSNAYEIHDEDSIRYYFNSSKIIFNLDESFCSKNIRIEDSEDFYVYEYDEWILQEKFIYINNEQLVTYVLFTDFDGNIISCFEKTYYDNGKILTSTRIYYDNELTKKYYSTYDENGKEVSMICYRYINNEWVKTSETRYFGGMIAVVYSLELNEDNTFETKTEYNYTEAGTELSHAVFKYMNNEWMKVEEDICINGKERSIYYLAFNDDNSIKTIYETEYDENANMINHTTIDYVNNDYDKKSYCSFDKNGNKLIEINSKYEKDSWVYTSKKEYMYENNKLVNYKHSKHLNNQWILLDEYIGWSNYIVPLFETLYNGNDEFVEKIWYTYDNDGNIINRIRYEYLDGKWVLKEII